MNRLQRNVLHIALTFSFFLLLCHRCTALEYPPSALCLIHLQKPGGIRYISNILFSFCKKFVSSSILSCLRIIVAEDPL